MPAPGARVARPLRRARVDGIVLGRRARTPRACARSWKFGPGARVPAGALLEAGAARGAEVLRLGGRNAPQRAAGAASGGRGAPLSHHRAGRARAGAGSRGRDPRPAREGATVRLSDLPVAGRQEALARARGARPHPGRLRRARPPAAVGKGVPAGRGHGGGISPPLLKGSRRGRDVLAFLVALDRPATGAEITLSTGAGPAVLRSLLARGALRAFDQARKPEEPAPLAARAAFRLTGEQGERARGKPGGDRAAGVTSRRSCKASPGAGRPRCT
jgi:hypothetical protein